MSQNGRESPVTLHQDQHQLSGNSCVSNWPVFASQTLSIPMAAVTIVSCHSPHCFQEVHPAGTSQNILLPVMELNDMPFSYSNMRCSDSIPPIGFG
jgi:hypothetical protein